MRTWIDRQGSRTRAWLAAAAAALAVGIAAGPAAAVSIGLSPSTMSPLVGGTFAVDVVVSGLGDGAPPSLGAFDLSLSFDPAALVFESASFDVFLGAIPAEATAEALAGIGTVSLAEFSVLAPAALDALQSDSFRLATVVFRATAATPSAIDFDAVLLGDGEGAALPLSAPPAGATISPVPEPSAALAFAIGIALLARASRRMR